MTVGSSYSTVKQALTDAFLTRQGLVNVSISTQAPLNPSDLSGQDGSLDAIWTAGTEGEYSDQCFRALPLAFDETYGLTLIIQSLRDTTAGTQIAADTRVDEMLYEVAATIADDPTLGLGDSFNYIFVLPASFKRITGFLPTGKGHGSRCELTVEVQCRHTF